jgi:hypothetical protein
MNGSYTGDKKCNFMKNIQTVINMYKGGEYKCNNCGVNWLTLEEQDREAFINLSEGPISQYLTHTHELRCTYSVHSSIKSLLP